MPGSVDDPFVKKIINDSRRVLENLELAKDSGFFKDSSIPTCNSFYAAIAAHGWSFLQERLELLKCVTSKNLDFSHNSTWSMLACEKWHDLKQVAKKNDLITRTRETRIAEEQGSKYKRSTTSKQCVSTQRLPWTDAEDEILRNYVEMNTERGKNGKVPGTDGYWSSIFKDNPILSSSRTIKSMNERYNSVLDLSINKADFTPEEIRRMVVIYKNQGSISHTKAAHLLGGGRTGNKLKIYYNKNLKQLTTEI